MKYLKFFPFYILSLIPLPILFLISDFVYLVIYYGIKYRRDVVRTNLKNSFPDKSAIEIVQIEKKFYRHFCDITFESIKGLTISKKAIAKRVHIKNKELIDELYGQQKNIIMYTSHYGNWEWLIFLQLFLPYQVQIFYQKLSNNYFNDLLLLIRSRYGSLMVQSSQGYKTMVKSQQEGTLTLTCIVGDQSPKKTSSQHWVKFLNQETAFFIGTDRIAEKLNQTVIFASFHKPRRGQYEIEFIPLADNPDQSKGFGIIDEYAEVLENTITQRPELWLWSHKRWKLTKPDQE